MTLPSSLILSPSQLNDPEYIKYLTSDLPLLPNGTKPMTVLEAQTQVLQVDEDYVEIPKHTEEEFQTGVFMTDDVVAPIAMSPQ